MKDKNFLNNFCFDDMFLLKREMEGYSRVARLKQLWKKIFQMWQDFDIEVLPSIGDWQIDIFQHVIDRIRLLH